jgi:hypothetical protein
MIPMEESKSTGQMATAKNTKVQEDTAMATAAITQQDDAVIKIEDHADTPNASGNLSDEDAYTETKIHPPDRDDDERSPTRRPYPIRDARMMTSCPSPSPQNIVTSGLTAANFATPPPPEKRGDNLLLQPPSTTSTELHSGLSIPSLLRFPSQPSQPGDNDAATMLSLNTPNLVNPNEAEQHIEHIVVIPRIRLAMRPSNRNNSPNHQHDDGDATGGAIDRREMTTTAGFVPIVQLDPREGGRGGEEDDDE